MSPKTFSGMSQSPIDEFYIGIVTSCRVLDNPGPTRRESALEMIGESSGSSWTRRAKWIGTTRPARLSPYRGFSSKSK